MLERMTDSVLQLYKAVIDARERKSASSRTARLFDAGRGKISKKVAEEAVEVVVDALRGKADAVVRESADLIYHLVVLWADVGVRPEEVWGEMRRREQMLGIAEKLPKGKDRYSCS